MLRMVTGRAGRSLPSRPWVGSLPATRMASERSWLSESNGDAETEVVQRAKNKAQPSPYGRRMAKIVARIEMLRRSGGMPTASITRMSSVATTSACSAAARPMLFAHGFGCDQNMWRLVAPAFADDYRVVLFDHVGAGGSDVAAYDRRAYGTLDGYAADVLEICDALELSRRRLRRPLGERDDRRARGQRATGAIRRAGAGRALAALHRRRRATSAASRAQDIEELLELARQQLPRLVERDGAGRSWATPIGRSSARSWPTASAGPTPRSRAHFARVTFLSDNRADLARGARCRRSILQCSRRRDRAARRSASTSTPACPAASW